MPAVNDDTVNEPDIPDFVRVVPPPVNGTENDTWALLEVNHDADTP